MNTRRLVKSGNSSLVIALPKEWIERNKLKHKGEVFVMEQDNKLIIQNEYKVNPAKKEEKVIEIDGRFDRIVARDIISAYLNNYEYVLIRGKTLKDRLQFIKRCVSGLVAFEVVDESSEKLLVKNFLNLQDINMPILIRRMDNIVRSMIIDVKDILKDPSLLESKTHSLVANVVDRDVEVNKLNYLISKVLKTVYNDPGLFNYIGIKNTDILPYWDVCNAIEKIGDRVKYIIQLISELSASCRKKFLDLLIKVEECYKQIMKAFYDSSTKIADEVAALKDEMIIATNKYSSHNCVTCAKIATNIFSINGHVNDISRIIKYIMVVD